MLVPRPHVERVRRPTASTGALVAAVAAALVATVCAPIGHAATRNPAYFETPSRNIACAWYRDLDRPARTHLRCEIGSLLSPMPPRPAWCDVDWGYGLSMASTGTVSVLCAGDTIRHAPRTGAVLGYGRTWRRSGFTCRSTSAGLTCRNTSRHGFFLSRERWRRF